MKANNHRFLDSFSAELLSQANRVRDLIGDAHWLSDGRHKEELLRVFLRNHLPDNILVASGFVLLPTEENICSREQDILLVDTNLGMPIFRSGDIIVTPPHCVIAALSVKSTYDTQKCTDSVETLNSVRNIIARTPLRASNLFCAAIFFDLPSSAQASIHESLVKLLIDHPAIGPVVSRAEHGPTPIGPDLILSLNSLGFTIRFYQSGEGKTLNIMGHNYSGYSAASLLHHINQHLMDLGRISRANPSILDSVPVEPLQHFPIERKLP